MRKIICFFFFLCLLTEASWAQKVDYISLINRSNRPQLFFDTIMLPAEDSQTNLSIIFRFDNDFLPFKKLSFENDLNAPKDAGFYTITRLSSEIFEGKARRRDSNIEIVSRDLWVDTLYAKTFEDTESSRLFASGSLTSTLPSGHYYYVLQLNLMESTNDRNSDRRNIRIPDWNNKKDGEVILVKAVTDSGNSKKMELLGLSNNVFFGEDFYSFIRIPKYNSETTYSVHISRAQIGRRDTTSGQEIHSYTLKPSDFLPDILPTVTPGKNPAIITRPSDAGYTYALVKIPNSEFHNAAYILELSSEDSEEPLARKVFRSYWPDMPASLYNLEIAIDHMKFIVSEDQLKKIKSGNDREKERKFREFWASKDPTPNTVYNELMAEYYRRIDYAFNEFSNRGNLAGHESDQGEVYIKYGPPLSKERQFPTKGNVVEVWEYKNRKFVFEATTGFGDFVLKGSETK